MSDGRKKSTKMLEKLMRILEILKEALRKTKNYVSQKKSKNILDTSKKKKI